MFALVAEIGPMRMTTITYVNPAVAIVAGALILGERVTVVTVVGFVLVLAGSYLVTRKRRELVAPPDPEAVPLIESELPDRGSAGDAVKANAHGDRGAQDDHPSTEDRR